MPPKIEIPEIRDAFEDSEWSGMLREHMLSVQVHYPTGASGRTVLLEFVSTHPLHPPLLIPLTPEVAGDLAEDLSEAWDALRPKRRREKEE